jgi:hypothetical protein
MHSDTFYSIFDRSIFREFLYDIYFCRYATTSVESFYKYIQVLLILSGHCYLQTL